MFLFVNSTFFLELQVFANLDHIDHTKHTLFIRSTNINTVNTFEQGHNIYVYHVFVLSDRYLKIPLLVNIFNMQD